MPDVISFARGAPAPEALDGGLIARCADAALAADPTVIDTTVVAGRVLMRGGRLVGDDITEIVARVRERVDRLGLHDPV